MRIWQLFVALVVLGCGAGCVNGLFYQPTHREYQTPTLSYEAVTFASTDGTPLTGWFLPAAGKPQGTVVHFHGNAQNMTAHYSFVSWLPAEGFNVFVFDYQGYGQSAGQPSRRGLVEDSAAALRYVRQRPDVDPGRIVILAQSLGGANAIVALGQNEFQGVRGVVLDSAFASYRRIVRDKIALVPIVSLLRWPLSFVMVSNGCSPDDYIGRIAPVPVVLMHGTADRVVPYHHAQALYARAGDPKALWTVEGGDHTSALMQFGSEYRPRVVEFFQQALAATNAPGE